MQVVLVMLSTDGQRRSFPLNREMTIIGRRDDCDLRIPVSDVSRKHCRLVKEEGGVRIEDLGSSNGTYRNGERIQEAMLEAGDHVQVGPLQFIVQIDGVPADEEITFAPPPEAEENAAAQSGGDFDPMSALLGDGGDSAVEVDLSNESGENPTDEEV